ncbi:MAG: winged helix-turn-helix transcriptional regulator [Methylobacterium sp.]|nr:winged helix-turn-helix transcriptional regulator [Methylobacterium sp.]MCA3654739.1 winged helix-turn-helix transcriptional regulator [Methylobacterium sp.]MCA3658298.1 winged helix-turn-helix transcriptional regulator [Methylobacterium sp.]MCA3661497.1 winged helix-turn-helix transcriptional regulator [Methylobacterium sp.]MCA3664901.1 winged helix-turn-helix transcriptional regulator [Methylobacterium sp.]
MANTKQEFPQTVGPSKAWPSSLEKTLQITEAIRDADPGMPITWALMFLNVAKYQDQKKEGLSIRDLSDIVGISYSSVAEIVKKMSSSSHRFPDAVGLLQVKTDALDERRKILKLSSKGQALLRKISLINSHADQM